MAQSASDPSHGEQKQDDLGYKPLVKLLILLVIMTACLLIVRKLDLGGLFQDAESRQKMRDFMGPWLPLGYIAMGTVFIAVGFPRVAWAALGGALFGFTMGTVWGHIATMTGSLACFYFAQSMGREWVQHKFGRRFRKLEQRLHDEGFSLLLMVRLSPVGNNFLTNCLAGASAMRGWPFFNASLIGHLPQTIFFALVGSGVVKNQHSQTTIAVIGLVAFLLFFLWYFGHSRKGREIIRELRGKENSDADGEA